MNAEARAEAGFGPLLNSVETEAPTGVSLARGGAPPPTGFTVAVFVATIGVIDLDIAFKHIDLLTRGHCLHQFVLNEPRRWRGNA